MATVLLLGGTREAYHLAEILSTWPGMRVISSLAGRTASPRCPAGEVRVGGFGGIEGLAAFLQSHQVTAVLDATHPFARQIGPHAAQACAQQEVPLLRLERPAWQPMQRDRWLPVQTWEQAQAVVAQTSQRALLAVGRQELAPFCDLANVFFLIRSVQAPDPIPPFAQAEWVFARGPFSVEHEQKLLQDYRLDTIICKNSGGPMDAKLAAARALGVQVVMLARPPQPIVPTIDSLEKAVTWLKTVTASHTTPPKKHP